MGSVSRNLTGREMLRSSRNPKLICRSSEDARYRSSPVIVRRCSAFHVKMIGGYVSGMNRVSSSTIQPAVIVVSQSVHLQLISGLVAMKSATVGARNGMMKLQTERIGKT